MENFYLAHPKELKNSGEGQIEIIPTSSDTIKKHELEISDKIWENGVTEKVIEEIKKVIYETS